MTYLEGDAVWEAGDKGRLVVEELLHPRAGPQPHGQPRRHPAEPRGTSTRREPRGDVPTKPAIDPLAFLIEYADGLRATVLILNGHVNDATVAARIDDSNGGRSIVSTLMYLPALAGHQLLQPAGATDRGLLPHREAAVSGPADPTDRGILDVALRTASAATVGSRPPSWRQSITRPRPTRASSAAR